LKLDGPSLVQIFIGDGTKLTIDKKRFDSDRSGDREVQRTMLEQLDGFGSDDRINKVGPCPKNILTQLTAMKVITTTNGIDILSPVLLRSGRLDRNFGFLLPNDTARSRILQIHSRKMATSSDVNYEELERSTDEFKFNGVQLKALCVEAGMITLALREWYFSKFVSDIDSDR
jgi:26S proteasome regulatory subunit T5